jgi:galactonate dehydratase
LVDKTVFEYKDGYVNIPDKPGLGIEINEEHVRKMAEVGITGATRYGAIRMAA